MKEAYCSYEIAKLLKENGFAEPCNKVYNDEGIITEERLTPVVPFRYKEKKKYLCPTHQMACAWLRKKGYHIAVIYQYKSRTWQRIIQASTGVSWSLGGFESHDETVEEALKYVLENLI